MQISNIENKKLKQLVIESDDYIQFDLSPKQLIDEGWVFDDSIDYIMEEEDCREEDAIQKFDENYIIYLRVLKIEEDKIHTTYEINSMKDHLSNIHNGISEDTGNNEGTIEDIITLGLV